MGDESPGLTKRVARPRIKAIEKMADVLHVFSPLRPAWKLHELERHLGWDKATTYRFLEVLVAIRMLERTDEGVYHLGLLPVELSAVYLGVNPIRRELLGRTTAIAERTGLTTQLGVLDGDSVVIVASSEGSHALRAAAMLGQRLPLHATAAGKAILSQLDVDVIATLVPERTEQFTDRTVRTRRQLLAEVEEVRALGVARADSELAPGLFALAVPISRGLFAEGPAAVACAGPSPTLTPLAWELAETELCNIEGDLASRHEIVTPLRREKR